MEEPASEMGLAAVTGGALGALGTIWGVQREQERAEEV